MPNRNLIIATTVASFAFPALAVAGEVPVKTAKVAYSVTAPADVETVADTALIMAKATTRERDHDWLRVTYRAEDRALVQRNADSSAESRYVDMGRKGLRPTKIRTVEEVDTSVTLEFEMGSGEAPEGEHVHDVDAPVG